MTSALSFASEAAEHGADLPFAPAYFGAIAIVVFLLLLAITWAFKNTAAKVAEQRATGHVGHGTVGAHASAHEPGHR